MSRHIIAAFLLMASGLLRAAGEAVEIVETHPSPLSGILAALGLATFAMGLLGIRRDPLGRVALGATMLGVAGYILIALHSVIVLGAPTVDAVARTPAFMLSGLATVVGIAALALWLRRAPGYPAWLGPVMFASVAASIITSYVALPPITQPLLDMLMATTFFQFGLSMYQNARTTPVPPSAS